MNELASLTLARDGGLAIAEVSGEVDFSNAEDLGTRIAQWVSNEDARLVLDFTKLSYTDSAGINLVFDLSARLRERGQTLAIVLPVDSQPWRTFAIVGVEAEVPIFETLAAAHAGLGPPPARIPPGEDAPSEA